MPRHHEQGRFAPSAGLGVVLLMAFAFACAAVFLTLRSRRLLLSPRSSALASEYQIAAHQNPSLARVAGAAQTHSRAGKSTSMAGAGHDLGDIVVIDAAPDAASASGAVIFLHGLGDSGHGWHPAFSAISPLCGGRARVILPTAAELPVSINGGMRQRAWFDLYEFPVADNRDVGSVKEDRDNILAGVARVQRIVDAQVARGIDPAHVIVGGFSQGGAIALAFALHSPTKIGGVLALSTWLPLLSEFKKHSAAIANKDTPVWMAHGTQDPVVQPSFGARSAAALKEQMGFSRVHYENIPNLGHSVDMHELQQVKTFIESVLE
ncbi:Acyl-protein thioesterase 1 [Porphyridium purpureum]|uniref:Acyl-protein thioesterase 1 n=1 Tax=Porphyridium purpureum TaxID=35688 RepID=A0A5J4Z5I4_PORPP|nr:Acyl-protein thioesterase 1 [Porphyridium purpureum]|eukprot:POR8567..scf295_1